jgi:hypothetical protein
LSGLLQEHGWQLRARPLALLHLLLGVLVVILNVLEDTLCPAGVALKVLQHRSGSGQLAEARHL